MHEPSNQTRHHRIKSSIHEYTDNFEEATCTEFLQWDQEMCSKFIKSRDPEVRIRALYKQAVLY